ncbi:MAG: hypothetical protein KY451_08390 [Actinobacteria bacterium]|nr:hypothetical protein [Actinomycetota bacterium]MBW3647123.1 hypothetical protein [Actinomycetota bacterium]
MAQTLLASTYLGALDRCDRCGAQAYVRAVLAAGELLFCAHHGREYGEKLSRDALLVEDNSSVLRSSSGSAAA